MAQLIAESTNYVEYIPKMNGLPLTAAPSTIDVYLYNGHGDEVSLSAAPMWDISTYRYFLTIEDTEVPSSAVGELWTFKWVWSVGSDILTDVEYATVVNSIFNELVIALRRKIRDTGTFKTDYFVGDGLSTQFRLTADRIKYNSEYITINNSGISTSAYSLDYETGMLVLTSAAVSGGSLIARYISYDYSDADMNEYLQAGITLMNQSTESSCSSTNPSLTDFERQLVLLLATRELYVDEMLASAGTSFSWRDEEKQFNRSGLTGNYKDAIQLIEEKIKRILMDLTAASGGIALTGGYPSILFTSLDWETINERNTIP